MDYYNVNDPACQGYRVEHEGTWRDDAVEASHSEGWVKVEEKINAGWGYTETKKKTLYGRVFIVKYLTHQEEKSDRSTADSEHSSG